MQEVPPVVRFNALLGVWNWANLTPAQMRPVVEAGGPLKQLNAYWGASRQLNKQGNGIWREGDTLFFGTVHLTAPGGLQRSPQYRVAGVRKPDAKSFAQALLLGRRKAGLSAEADLLLFGQAVDLLFRASLTQGAVASLVHDYGLPGDITWHQVLCCAYNLANNRR